MTKKKEETLDSVTVTDVSAQAASTVEVSQDDKREAALYIALSHHKTNGGMLTAQQLIDNAKLFNAYISGTQS